MTHDTTHTPPTPSPTQYPPLVIAGHGTRDAEGAATCLALVDRVRTLLDGVRVEAGFVELTPPTIDEALSTVLESGSPSVVVVPLMIGTGGHVREDIPEAIEAGKRDYSAANVVYTRHLGSPKPLVNAARQRIDTARDDWAAKEVTVVFVGRGCSVADANADHARLARVIHETGGYHQVIPAFIQVASPDVTTGLNNAYLTGARKIVVMPHYLFPGRLTTWVHEQVGAWVAGHSDAEVRIAEVIGDCPELAEVVAARYREGRLAARTGVGSAAYLTGLLLENRKVVAVGGGCVNRRRVPKLVEAGAQVTVISPTLHPVLAELADQGIITWERRDFAESDVDGAWYVLAATDSPDVNRLVAEAAEARHTFCVRADQSDAGSAWTPATGDVPGATVAVLSDRNPRRSRELRDHLVELLNADHA